MGRREIIPAPLKSSLVDLSSYDSNKLDILSADALDLKIRRETIHPQIGISFFEIDDDEFRESFESHKDCNTIHIRAKCREEAIYCIVNELWRTEDHRPVYIIRSKESWDKLATLSNGSNVYIPWFYADEITAIENNTNVFIYTDGIPSFSRDELILRPRTLDTIRKSLVNAGLRHGEADTLVNETHGLYIPMKKKIINGQYLKKPAWVDELPEIAKRTCLLVGQWTEADGDKEIISLLYGKEDIDFAVAAVSGRTISSQLKICALDEKNLAIVTWNSLWDCILLGALFNCQVMSNIQCDKPVEELETASYLRITNYEFRGIVVEPYKMTDEDKCWIEMHYSDAFQLLDREPFMTATHAMASYKWHSMPRVQLAVIWSGIEALFEASTEITFRISLYIANFLSPDDTIKAREIFSNTKKLYASRSAAVHGGKIKGDINALVSESAWLHNRIIRRCAEIGDIPNTQRLVFIDKD